MEVLIVLSFILGASSLCLSEVKFSVEYFLTKNVKLVTYFSCESQYQNKLLVKELISNEVIASVVRMDREVADDIMRSFNTLQWGVNVGILLDSSCLGAESILSRASKANIFDAEHIWLILTKANDIYQFIENRFGHLNLSINADVTVASGNEENYTLTDVFNFGSTQGNSLEVVPLGTWSASDGDDNAMLWYHHRAGLMMEQKVAIGTPKRNDLTLLSSGFNLEIEGFKYYQRWDFHNLTLRAISVMDERQAGISFRPELLTDDSYTPGVTAMTKITSQLLNLLKDQHNFRFNYLVADRWIGSPERNSTLGVTNSLYWREADVSSTCARIFPLWLHWVDICFPPTTNMETKFYYLIPDKGIGDYENRFISPLSAGVWWCTLAAGALCGLTLAAAAWLEARPKPAAYAFFSVAAAICQQGFEDGVQEKVQSQGRRLIFLVVGITSMLLYNYYTSSVVSWLLSAATPSIAGLDGLIASNLEIVFEDIGYTRGWLDGHKKGFQFYYNGYVDTREDKLRETKVTNAKRTASVLQPIDAGMQLIRSGAYAYHTEPYTAQHAIARSFSEDELCELAELQMLIPANVYVMVQKRSPYKQFFVWSLMRLAERGHMSAVRARFSGAMPACSGRRPRALALGQAAPAFLLLLEFAVLSVMILVAERIYYKFNTWREGGVEQKRSFVR